MILRPRRRNLVVWRQSAVPAGRRGAPRPGRARRIRRWIRISALLTVIGLLSFARAVRPRWRQVLAGMVLTTIGVVLRNGPGNVVLLPGLLFLASAPLTPGRPDGNQMRRCELERELAVYSTPAQRSDLEATLDQYPDNITRDLRDILARQAVAARESRFPGVGPS